MPAAMTGMDRENGTFRFEPMRAFAVNMNQIQTAPTGFGRNRAFSSKF